MATKIIIFSPGASSGGGIHSVVTDQVSYFLKKGIPFQVVDTSGKSLLNKISRFFICVVTILKLGLIKEDAFFVFHIASGKSFYRKSFLIVIAKYLCRYDYYLHLHGGMFKVFYSHNSNLVKSYIAKIFYKSKAVIVLSESWRDWVLSIGLSNSVFVIPNSVSVSENITDSDLLYLERDIDILFVGRVELEKGISELLDVLNLPKLNDKNVVFAGSVSPFFSKLNSNNKIQMLGQVQRSDVFNLMVRSKILVLPSHFEAFPVVILEAMLNGAICICSNVGSIPEIITHGVNGFIFPVKNVQKLEEVITSTLESYEELHYVRRSAFEMVVKKYSLQENMKALVKLYGFR